MALGKNVAFYNYCEVIPALLTKNKFILIKKGIEEWKYYSFTPTSKKEESTIQKIFQNNC